MTWLISIGFVVAMVCAVWWVIATLNDPWDDE